MKYRLDLKNGNNSQQLLEVINQGIGDSLERQLDYVHAPTIAGHLNPRPAQLHPEVKQRQPDQQQSQDGIARTSAAAIGAECQLALTCLNFRFVW